MALLPAPAASAAPAVESRALAIAESKRGDPYRYGAAGPSAFDCSGLVSYSYHRAGHSLPRTAAGQYRATHHISGSHREVGDLVFFHSGGSVYHVGIYVGGGRILHAPYPGRRVGTERLWTSAVWYGRIY
ncbi:glycoside hydrolase [Mangrovactinospora gilvigrisea]|uniref:Glycoside hydrolase n=1 Tax=Mangrovactinospora gilvigrisea TaxID=1428644 RepID=A0A1J7BA27_9ACTN|nr:glycoside hydrolase [Mangrovactinospora gilvigrisea]